VRSSSILNQNGILSKIGNWPPRLFLFAPEEIHGKVDRLGNVCVVRHRVFLGDVGASYLLGMATDGGLQGHDEAIWSFTRRGYLEMFCRE
jgi:hypothetical protein